MSVNWKMDETALGRETFAEDFDDYGRGEDHKVSIGDEVEATDKYGRTHAGVVVGIIRDINVFAETLTVEFGAGRLRFHPGVRQHPV